MDPPSIEAEMRRFEDEISSKDAVPNLPPPPMFVSNDQPTSSGQSQAPMPPTPPINTSMPKFMPPNYTDSSQQPGCSSGNMMMPGPMPPPGMPNMGRMPSFQNNMPNRMNGPPGFMSGPMMPMPPMGPMPPNMGGMRPMFDPMVPMPPFVPPPVMPDFSKFLEGQAVYSSAPVLKKPKLDPAVEKKESKEKKDSSKDAATADKSDTSSKTTQETSTAATTNEATTTTTSTAVETPKLMTPYNNTTPLNMPPQQHQFQQQQQQQNNNGKPGKRKKNIRTAAGQKWEDPTLNEWDPSDYRIFCGDLGNEVTDDTLTRVFTKYASFQKARVVRDKNTNKSRGYGFVSMKDPNDFIHAIREMNGKYVGNRPIKLKKSNWRERNVENVRKKIKEKKRLGYKV